MPATCYGLPGLDLGRPTQREAFWISVISTLAAGFVLVGDVVGILVSTADREALIADLITSGLDVFSSILVVYRFALPNALSKNSAVQTFENRTAAGLALLMIVLAVINTGFAAGHLSTQDQPSKTALGIEDTLALPASVLYTIIGMSQLHMGWILGLESLVADGVISMVGAGISFASVLATIVNLIYAQPPPALVIGIGVPGVDPELIYPYYYLEDVFSILLSLVLLVVGATTLTTCWNKDAGPAWYTLGFWTQPHPSGEGKSEASPLHGGA